MKIQCSKRFWFIIYNLWRGGGESTKHPILWLIVYSTIPPSQRDHAWWDSALMKRCQITRPRDNFLWPWMIWNKIKIEYVTEKIALRAGRNNTVQTISPCYHEKKKKVIQSWKKENISITNNSLRVKYLHF